MHLLFNKNSSAPIDSQHLEAVEVVLRPSLEIALAMYTMLCLLKKTGPDCKNTPDASQ